MSGVMAASHALGERDRRRGDEEAGKAGGQEQDVGQHGVQLRWQDRPEARRA